MQGLVTRGSRLGTKLRKREYQMRTGPPLRPGEPPEFGDPNLNEGWYDHEEAEGKEHRRAIQGHEEKY